MEGLSDLAGLKGRCVLITGGASGIGRASADLFAAAGAYVTIADIQPEETVGFEIIEEYRQQGAHVNYVYCDTTDWDSQIAAFQNAICFCPRQTLNVVLMCAGLVSDHGSLLDHLADVRPDLVSKPPRPKMRVFDVNLLGVYYSTYLALNYMRLEPLAATADSENETAANKHEPTKSLIFLDSMAGYFDFPKHTGYNVSKMGARGLFRSIRSTTAEFGIRCNLIAPWFVKTPMTVAMQGKIPDGKGITWTRLEDVMLAIRNCAVNEDLDGRALSVLPEGIFDLHDELETAYGGDVLQKIYKLRKLAGDIVI